jgi:beta-N-acetylhexosaminidase
MKIRLFVIILGLALISCRHKKEITPAIDKINFTDNFQPSDSGWMVLSLREKIGQIMLMLPDRQKELELGDGTLKGFFEKYPVSGFFMGWKLFDNVKPEDKVDVQRLRTLEYAGASKYPLFFQEDYEAGILLPGMTSFPNEMALGAANSSQLAYDYGKAVNLEARSLGINYVLHPIVDLNQNPFNPLINIRSISDDPDKAVRLLSQQIRGIQDLHVAATIKSFPGDGVDYRDQHLVTGVNPYSMEQWWQNHGKVFQELINMGAKSVMPVHITLPAYQKEKINGLFPPATLSKELLTGLLKNDMGFKGVIVSDAMVMAGFRDWYPTQLEGEIQSFMAGVDLMLWPSYQFMDTLELRIKRGEIPVERLNDAVRRVWNLKEWIGLFKKDYQLIRPMSDEENLFVKKTARDVCEKAVTLVWDKTKSLPVTLKKDKRLLLVGVTPVSRKGGSYNLEMLRFTKEEFERRGYEVDFQHNLLYETQGWTEEVTSKYDRIIFLLVRTPHSPFGPLQFYDDEAQSIWAINAMPKNKTIVVSYGDPYTPNEYFQRVNTVINAYSVAKPMQEATVKALTGEILFTGTSPVNLDLKWPVTISF